MNPLTHTDIQRLVLHCFGPEVKLLNYRLEPYSKNNCGVLGTHRTLVIDIKHGPNKNNESRSHSFFIKTEPDVNIRNFIMDENIFYEEVHFYKEIHPQLLESSKCEKWSPQCYLARRDVLVFEDLRNQGFQSSQELILKEKYVKSALTSLARLHASSIAAEARLGDSLRNIYPGAFDEMVFSNVSKLGRTTQFSFDTMALIAERFGLDTSLVPKIAKYVYQMVKNNTTSCSVICHCDLWKNNLMFDDADPPNCILIDYQLLRYHSPVLDIGMALYLNTTPQFRKKSELSMLQHYYSALRAALDQSEHKLNIPSYESIVNAYQEYRLVSVAYACMYLPGIYMNLDFVEILNNSLLMKKWLLESRIDQISSAMDNDPIYETKIKQLIDEFMEEGKRIMSKSSNTTKQ